MALPLSIIMGYILCVVTVINLKLKSDNQASFDLRWKADMRAIKQWHESGGDKLVWPDHADLCVWLLSENDRLIKQNKSLKKAFKHEQDERCDMFTQSGKDMAEIKKQPN